LVQAAWQPGAARFREGQRAPRIKPEEAAIGRLAKPFPVFPEFAVWENPCSGHRRPNSKDKAARILPVTFWEAVLINKYKKETRRWSGGFLTANARLTGLRPCRTAG